VLTRGVAVESASGVDRRYDRTCPSARRDPSARHTVLCGITRVRGLSHLITRSAAHATVITTDGTVLSEHVLNPNHGYQPKRKNG
jgi:hypothetical protein